MQKNKLFFILSLLACLLTFKALTYAQEEPLRLMFFHSPSCSRCLKVKQSLLPIMEIDYGRRLKIEYYDVTEAENYRLLLSLRDQYSPGFELELPIFFVRGNLLNGKADLENALPALIESSFTSFKENAAIKEKDIIEHFRSLRLWVILGAGLVDGINPCAFTVIVFFISYLALRGYKRRELAVVGFSFAASVFITYSLIGLGLFNFLYRFRGFWVFARVFNLLVAVLSILLGFMAVYDLVKFLKTKETQGLMLQLPRVIKNRIHGVISERYRRPDTVFLPRVILSAFITGFLVSLLEAVCTGQLYLPTIAFVLKTTPLKLKAFVYLVSYNIMFILPLLVILFLALLGFTSGQFSSFLKKNLVFVKAIMALVFFLLGISLFIKF